jgi:hypothetical protein
MAMKEIRQWWHGLVAKWRGAGADPEDDSLKELDQEVELLGLEEQTAQIVAKLSQVNPSLGREHSRLAEREASELAVRRRTLEDQRDVLVRRQRQSRAG